MSEKQWPFTVKKIGCDNLPIKSQYEQDPALLHKQTYISQNSLTDRESLSLRIQHKT